MGAGAGEGEGAPCFTPDGTALDAVMMVAREGVGVGIAIKEQDRKDSYKLH
jgi:hypothetical protein